MKKILLSLLIFIPFLTIQANHLLGGEITWKCLSNGQYEFLMEVYRDCSDIPWSYQDEVLTIVGSPLPSNGVVGIFMRPDTVRWVNENNGDLSQQCNSSTGVPYSCANGDVGAVQAFYYRSAPVTLTGTPPQNGWSFYWEAPCCRNGLLENVVSNGTTLLRAIMYSDVNNSSIDTCFDSSPEFVGQPEMTICRDYTYTGNVNAFDVDLDSISFVWGQALNTPASNPTPLSYKSGFSQASPTPGLAANSNNIPASINAETGEIKLATFSGSGRKQYLMVQQVDSYRKGKKIASVFREFPIALEDCNAFSNGNTNTVPEIKIDGTVLTSKSYEAAAGQLISIPVQISDNDITGVGSQLQELTLIPEGVLFSDSKTLPDRSSTGISPCLIPGVEPCAYLRNSSPSLDPNQNPPKPTVKGLGALNTEFVWQTSCNHIGEELGGGDSTENTYNFVMKVYDDYCPVPNFSAATLIIKVKAAPALDAPIMVGASPNLDGSVTYSWIPPLDTLSSFKNYKVYGAKPPNGGAATNFFQPLDTNLTKFSYSDSTSDFQIYDLVNPLNPNSAPDLFSPSGNKANTPQDYYLRMNTVSGCNNANTSGWSDSIRVMELTAIPAGTINSRDSVLLTWNTSGLSDSLVSPNVVSQSKRKYIIHVNDSVSNGGLTNPSNWYPIGETYDTTFIATSGQCNDFVAFRVEAVDTIVIGNLSYHSIDSLKTIVYSTYSFIDSSYVTSSKPVVENVNDTYLEVSYQRDSYQWIDCQTGLAISNETGRRFIPSSPGFYSVVAFGSGCTDTSACFEVTTIQDTIYSVGVDYLTTNTIRASWHWVACNNTSSIIDSSQFFIPTAAGSYAVRTKKFGFSSLSGCYTTKNLNTAIEFSQFDSIVSLDSNVYYQWNANCLDSSIAIVGETNRTFIPQAPGKYSLELSAYGYSGSSTCFLLNTLDDGIQILNNDSLSSTESASNYQWFDCRTGQNLPNGNERIYTVLDTGIYAVIVSAFGYSDTSDCVSMYAVGLEESNFQQGVSFFPNPTSGQIVIQLERMYQKLNINIRNLQGQLIQKENYFNTRELKLGMNVDSGVYFVEIQNEKGEQVNLKVIKQ